MSQGAWRYPGARWWKFDFHTHTPASRDTEWSNGLESEGGTTPREWLLAQMAAGVDCVAITDHNTGTWIDPLKRTYEELRRENSEEFRELHLFPGVELSVNGEIHLLVIFKREASTADVDELLGKVDYEGTKGDSDGVTRKSIAEVIQVVAGSGALPIPAHADKRKGLLELDSVSGRRARVDAGTLSQVFRDAHVAAAAVVDPSAPKPQAFEQSRVHWTEVIGTDCHSFSGDHAPGSRFTWVKMASPSLEGLKLALLDGGHFSIRRSDDTSEFTPLQLPDHFLESMTISNAR